MRNIALLFLTVSTITVSGQNHLLGVKGGTNWTEVTATNFLEHRNIRTGIAIGLTYDFLFKKHWSFGAEVIYNQRGFTSDMLFTNEHGIPTGRKQIFKSQYDYVSMPLVVGFNYGKTIYGFANIGLTPSILVSAKIINPTLDYDRTNMALDTLDITGWVNKFDIGGLVEIGGGYKFNGRYWLFTSFSYQHSVTSITNSDYFANSKIRHYGMTLNIGLKCALTQE